METLLAILMDVTFKNDTLIAIALLVFIICAVIWLIGARPWHRP